MNGVSTVNPATGEEIARYRYTTGAELSAVLDQAVASVGPARGERLAALAARLRAHSVDLADLITAEMGKPIVQRSDRKSVV